MKIKLTSEQIEEAKQLESTLRQLEEHQLSVRLPALNAAVASAEEAYLAEPNADRFAALKDIAFERELLLLMPRVPTMVDHAFKRFHATEIQPFFRPILERAVKVAERAAEKVSKEEYARIEQVTGHPAGPHIRSKAIDAAQEPIGEIQFLLSCIGDDATIASLDNFFAAFFEWATAS
ncbi:MAG TPA: hypothetical protein VEP30_04840 [Chthoniobacterales bacterium]|nr:hypothetical protein [Chthoniobacterales bacterium]